MVRLAEAAALIAAMLPVETYGLEQVREHQCRGAIELANAYRVANRLEEAQAELNRARRFFPQATRDRLLEARLHEMQANLCGDRRDFAGAFAAFDGAFAVYKECGDARRAARALIKKGIYTGYAGEAEEAIALLTEGLAQLAPDDDPQLTLAAVHNIAWLLVDCSRFREARILVWRHLSLYEQHGALLDRLKLLWLQGRIYRGLEDFARAEQALEEVRSSLDEAGKPYEAAIATLDLSVLLLSAGRAERARTLSLEAADVFFSLDVGRECLAAIILLKATFESRAAEASLDLLEHVADFMRKAVHDPQISFLAHFA